MKTVPNTHQLLTEMPDTKAFYFGCLMYSEGRWVDMKEVHPMSDLHISFVKKGIIAFPLPTLNQLLLI